MRAQSLCVQLFATLWTVASQGFYRQEYWSGLPSPPPGDLPDPGFESATPASSVLQAGSFPTEPPGKPALWHAGCSFPDQGLNPDSLQWKLRVLTTGSPGNYLILFIVA